MSDNVISYIEMCQREGASLRQCMRNPTHSRFQSIRLLASANHMNRKMSSTHSNIVPATGYLTGAISAFNGLQALAEAPRLSATDRARNCSILAALATECALKHHLAKNDVPERTIKQYRHDLRKLWTAARAAGLAIETTPPEWCRMLSDFTDGPLFFARYGYGATGAAVYAPDLLVAFIDELIRAVYPAQPPLQPRSDGTSPIGFPR